MKIPSAPSAQLPQGIESLRGRKDPEAVRAAAREMESLFAYEMVKAMRSASGGPASGEGFGGEVYGSLFDMELARVLSSRGLGLQELLLKGMGHAESAGKSATPPGAAAPSVSPSPISISPLLPSTVPVPAPSSAEAPGQPVSSAQEISDPHTHEPLEEGAFPIRDGGRVSSPFGYRKDPFTGETRFHHGVDIAAPEGTAVYPARGGEVTFSGHQNGYGNVVVIDHGNGFVTKYAHNRANRVAAGDRVDPETVIAEVGSSGRSTGPHLHFEVQYEGKKVPPLAVFAGIAKGRSGSSDKYS
ncbi:MAG: peptidoglycan DD-metalloendopeptidase family protein [Thermodesulfobacteriota bacterium]